MFQVAEMEAKGEDRVGQIEVGRHGLIVAHSSGQRGLLLPQVATENGWNSRTFLNQVCQKAGLPQNAWLSADTRLMKFEGRHFLCSPREAELDPAELSEAQTTALLSLALVACRGEEISDELDSVFSDHLPGLTGVLIETVSGNAATAIRQGASILELTREAASSIKENESKLRSLTLLTHPVPLRPRDYPQRHRSLAGSAIIAQHGANNSFTKGQSNPVAAALQSLKLQPQMWAPSGAELTSFRTFTIQGPPSIQSASRNEGVRDAWAAGKFFPGEPAAIQSELNSYFAQSSHASAIPCRAIMLPHAGWRFCGDIIAETLSRVELPSTVFVLGPKHTPHGANWSVSSSAQWKLPNTTIPVASDWVDLLCQSVPGLTREPDAHRVEHGVEVLLPFLHHRNPSVRIVPIAIGSADYESLQPLASALALCRAREGESPLLVISSDMNHFAEDQESQRRDQLALEELRKPDPKALYDTCLSNDISMCGLRPAVAVLQALLQEDRPCEVIISRYATSARVSGDTEKVVGYAGAIFS